MVDKDRPIYDSPGDLGILAAYCRNIRFRSGDILRMKGQHYREVYLITEGCVTVRLDDSDRSAQPVERGPGETVGEAGFLTGCAASETVTAKTRGIALVVDDRALQRIETEQPVFAAGIHRNLAGRLERWQARGAGVMGNGRHSWPGTNIEVYHYCPVKLSNKFSWLVFATSSIMESLPISICSREVFSKSVRLSTCRIV
jgi:CRP-like cAMP-binding protein